MNKLARLLMEWMNSYEAAKALCPDCKGDDSCACLYCRSKRAILEQYTNE